MGKDRWKKDGNPVPSFYESDYFIHKLKEVKIWLQLRFRKTITAEQLTAKSLAQLVIQLLQFQEQALGKTSKSPALTKIPVKYFHDCQAGGSLCCILDTAFKFKLEQGWRRFDLLSASRADRGLELMLQVVKNLQVKFLKPVSVFLSRKIKSDVKSELKQIVLNHQGGLVENEEDASHVVYPNPVASQKVPALYRPVMAHNDNMVIHKIGLPNSYDMWSSEIQPEIEVEDVETTLTHHVIADWLYKLDEFNEWMDEEDFAQDRSTCRKTYQFKEFFIVNEEKKEKKRQAEVVEEPPAEKRAKTEEFENEAGVDLEGDDEDITDDQDDVDYPFEDDLTSNMLNPPAEPTVQEVNIPRQSWFSRQKDLEFQPVKGAVYHNMDDLGDSDSSEDESEEQVHCRVPSYSSWFRSDAVHRIERHALPEFFDRSSRRRSSKVYVAYRNFIIDMYRSRRFRRLRFQSVRKHLLGDAVSIMRVFSFLELWGLINYCSENLVKVSQTSQTLINSYNLFKEKEKSLEAFLPVEVNSQKDVCTEIMDVSQLDESILNPPGAVQPVGLMTDKYVKRSETLGRSARGQQTSREWSDEETLNLLQALELYKDDWSQICLRVPGRTYDECILHFLRLPIDDPYRDGSQSTKGFKLHPDVHYEPFANSVNPTMSTLSFLSTTIDPRVAAAGSSAALVEYAKMREEDSAAQDQLNPVKSESDVDQKLDIGAPRDQCADNKRAAAAALSSAAQKTKDLLAIDRRRIELLACRLVQAQLQKLHIKFRHLEEIGGMMKTENTKLQNLREKLRHERAEIHEKAREMKLEQEAAQNAASEASNVLSGDLEALFDLT